MAVMVLQWFKFTTDGLDEILCEKAELRNDAMRQNAHSSLAYCGQDLAREVATVPVGVPETAIVDRRYTSDTEQPAHESFVHGVAALCCLRHFLASEPYHAGLYQMGAEDPTRLGGGNLIPSRESDGTLQDLANQAGTLATTLDAFAAVLAESHSGRFAVVPAIYREIRRLTDPRQASKEIRDLTASYREHLEWMQQVLGVEPQPTTALVTETNSRRRLIDRPISRTTNMSPQEVALDIFHWVAEWIGNPQERMSAGLPSSRPGRVNGGYWPPLSGDGLAVAADRAGDLTSVPPQNIEVTLDAFVDTDYVSQNGWPHPIAVADHFRYAIQREDRTAMRQLEMLLAGLVTRHLELREISETDESPEPVSLAALVNTFRDSGFPGVARYAVVWPAEDEVLGFNSPHTLLCAKPPSDQHAVRIWARLWTQLTGSDQPENWATVESPGAWRHADRAIRQIQTWLVHLKQRHSGTPPAWTRIFEQQPSPAQVPYGTDQRTFPLYWASTSETVPVGLPKADTGGYQPGEDTPLIPEDELLNRIPQLRRLRSESGHILYEMVEFEASDRERQVRGLWKEHLDHLQQHGLIADFVNNADDVSIWMPDLEHAATLERTWILDRNVMMIRRCSPMRQDPVPGSSTRVGSTRYPDLPLRSDYLDLVRTDAGRTVLDLLRDGAPLIPGEFEPAIDDTHQGRSATWTLRLKGRQDPLTISLPVGPEDDNHQAHWMVWPRFRSSSSQFWRSYYVYERCTDARLRLETLWLDPESNRVHRCDVQDRSGSHPIRFETRGGTRAHTGGPPVAFSVRDTVSEEEIGLYLIPLTPLSPNDKDLRIGIDFGTSHTVASILTGGERSVVELAAELDPANAETALTLHVSEDWSHVGASFDQDGLSALGVWLPNYVQSVAPDAKGLLPSELLTLLPLDRLNAEDVAEWQPGYDCVIPPMDMQRPDIADHILADFKWDASFPAFHGREPFLREIYLGMVVELVMADVVWRRRAIPSQPVDFTFTYPLRTQRTELNSFEETLRRLLENSSRSLGCKLTLRGETGTYNESRAAKGGTGNFGGVSLVGDLGGGTLDLFISANPLPGVEFPEVADSARLGGNLLLRTFARNPQRFLPSNAGWKFDDPEGLETQLRAWMRSKGSRDLFGEGAGDQIVYHGLDLRGFDQPSQADPARRLISRYFQLIAEYMARSLVAFLARDWYGQAPPHHHDKLQILVQLRGNGWRLWHDAVEYRRIEEEIGGRIESRARFLWQDPNLWNLTPPGPPDGNWAARDTGDANPKTAPILAAVGQAESRQDAERFKSHTLVQLDLLHAGSSPDPVPWFSSNRFKTGGKTTQVEINAIEPPLPLSPHDVEASIDDLDDQLRAEVNRKLREEGSFPNEVEFRAPVAPIVWEAAFKCRQFLGND